MKTFKLIYSVALMLFSVNLPAQDCRYDSRSIHSHNDYLQKQPLTGAYQQKTGIIEADVFCINNELMVAHEEESIKPENTLKKMYLDPIAKLYNVSNWQPFILMVDMKMPQGLDVLTELLKQYGDVFNWPANPRAVRVVVSGNRPDPADYDKYPALISFDGRPYEQYSPAQLSRIALISNGVDYYMEKGENQHTFSAKTVEKIKGMVEAAHAINKKVRLWGIPDNEAMWALQMGMCIDYIGSDKPEALVKYMRAKK